MLKGITGCGCNPYLGNWGVIGRAHHLFSTTTFFYYFDLKYGNLDCLLESDTGEETEA